MTDYNFKPKKTPDDFGWHDRGYLPHFDAGPLPQFVTFRLADSMPRELLDKWRSEATTDAEFRKRIEGYLDSGCGECWLGDPRIGKMVEDALLFHNESKYWLKAWVIMPNHGHVLLTPLENIHLPNIMHSIKSYTANEANKIIGRSGQFWQIESFDRYIRNLKHFVSTVRSIEIIRSKPVCVPNPKTGPSQAPDFADWRLDWSAGILPADWSAGILPASLRSKLISPAKKAVEYCAFNDGTDVQAGCLRSSRPASLRSKLIARAKKAVEFYAVTFNAALRRGRHPACQLAKQAYCAGEESS